MRNQPSFFDYPAGVVVLVAQLYHVYISNKEQIIKALKAFLLEALQLQQ